MTTGIETSTIITGLASMVVVLIQVIFTNVVLRRFNALETGAKIATDLLASHQVSLALFSKDLEHLQQNMGDNISQEQYHRYMLEIREAFHKIELNYNEAMYNISQVVADTIDHKQQLKEVQSRLHRLETRR